MAFAHVSIYPSNIFVNLLSDLAINDLIAACTTAAERQPEMAEVFKDCRNHLQAAQKVRAAMAHYHKM